MLMGLIVITLFCVYGCISFPGKKDYYVNVSRVDQNLIIHFYKVPPFFMKIRATIYLQTDKPYEKIFIKTVYFHHNGKTHTLLKNIKEDIPKMIYDPDSSYYKASPHKRNDGEFLIGGRIHLADIFDNTMDIGDEIIINMIQEYSFDDEELQTDIVPYRIRCIQQGTGHLYW
jgi:hypothetical protein